MSAAGAENLSALQAKMLAPVRPADISEKTQPSGRHPSCRASGSVPARAITEFNRSTSLRIRTDVQHLAGIRGPNDNAASSMQIDTHELPWVL
jgi:hypothetical protein